MQSFYKGEAEILDISPQTGNGLQDFEQGNDITRGCYLETEKKEFVKMEKMPCTQTLRSYLSKIRCLTFMRFLYSPF